MDGRASGQLTFIKAQRLIDQQEKFVQISIKIPALACHHQVSECAKRRGTHQRLCPIFDHCEQGGGDCVKIVSREVALKNEFFILIKIFKVYLIPVQSWPRLRQFLSAQFGSCCHHWRRGHPHWVASSWTVQSFCPKIDRFSKKPARSGHLWPPRKHSFHCIPGILQISNLYKFKLTILKNLSICWRVARTGQVRKMSSHPGYAIFDQPRSSDAQAVHFPSRPHRQCSQKICPNLQAVHPRNHLHCL